jgi:hypothetical protein
MSHIHWVARVGSLLFIMNDDVGIDKVCSFAAE